MTVLLVAVRADTAVLAAMLKLGGGVQERGMDGESLGATGSDNALGGVGDGAD
jgi:hypothetical protein